MYLRRFTEAARAHRQEVPSILGVGADMRVWCWESGACVRAAAPR